MNNIIEKLPVPNDAEIMNFCEKRGRPRLYNFEKMEVGDSMILDCFRQAKAHSLIKRFLKNSDKKWEFAIKPEGAGQRIWRIK